MFGCLQLNVAKTSVSVRYYSKLNVSYHDLPFNKLTVRLRVLTQLNGHYCIPFISAFIYRSSDI